MCSSLSVNYTLIKHCKLVILSSKHKKTSTTNDTKIVLTSDFHMVISFHFLKDFKKAIDTFSSLQAPKHATYMKSK